MNTLLLCTHHLSTLVIRSHCKWGRMRTEKTYFFHFVISSDILMHIYGENVQFYRFMQILLWFYDFSQIFHIFCSYSKKNRAPSQNKKNLIFSFFFLFHFHFPGIFLGIFLVIYFMTQCMAGGSNHNGRKFFGIFGNIFVNFACPAKHKVRYIYATTISIHVQQHTASFRFSFTPSKSFNLILYTNFVVSFG